jgi:hypothetical protein
VKEWLIKLTLIAFGFFIVIVSMVALEFGLSRFAPNPRTRPTGFYEKDIYIGYKGVPGKEKKYVYGGIVYHVKRNSNGFRDKERTYEKKKDTYRILVLGDSMTEGLQVPLEQTFPYILEEGLNSGSSGGSTTSLPLNRYPGSQRFEVINLGMTGFGTDQEYLTLKHYGLKYQPDFVILAFFIGNDVRENSLILNLMLKGSKVTSINDRGNINERGKPFFVLNDGELEELPFKIKVSNSSEDEKRNKRDVVKNFLTKLFPNIYYSLIDRINGTPWLANFLWEIGVKKSRPELFDKSEKSKIRSRVLMDYDIYAEEYPPEWQNAWEVTKGLILKLANELEINKIGLLVVIIPNEFEFKPDRWDKILDKNPQMRTRRFDIKKPERILLNFLAANNIDYLLLRPEFEKYSKDTGKDLHFQASHDGHWNTNGHALAAELIYKKVKEDKLVPMNVVDKQLR